MGQRLVALAARRPANLQRRRGARSTPRIRKLGDDAGHDRPASARWACRWPAELDAAVDVVIDFSVPAGDRRDCDGVPGTEGSAGGGHHRTAGRVAAARSDAAANTIPLLWAPSMSLAVNLAMKLTEIAAQALKDHPSGADVEIIERHHRFKEDAPSGTALQVRRDHRRRDGPDRAAARPRGPARPAAARRDRLSRRPHRRQSGRAHDHLRPAGRNAGDDGPRHQPRLLRPRGAWPPPSSWPASRRAVLDERRAGDCRQS